MVLKKIVTLLAVSTCPKCGNRGFAFELRPMGDESRPEDKMTCSACGHVCTSREALQAGMPTQDPGTTRMP